MRLRNKAVAAVLVVATAALADTYVSDTWRKTVNPMHFETGTWIEGVEAAAPGAPAAGRVRLYAKTGATGEWCSKDGAGVETCMSTGAGGGEANTASNLGGGLANWDSKAGVDLRFNSFTAADFNLAANLISIDTATWATDAEVLAGYQPLDADLTAIAALATTAFGRGLLDDADGAAVRTTIGAVIGTNVQAWDADLDAVAALATTAGGRSILATTPADDQVYVADGAGGGTWRTIPDCGEAGTLNYTQATNTFSCLTDGGGGGGANSVETSLALTTLGGYFTAAVTGQTWVAAGSEIVCRPFGTTADSLTPEVIAISGVQITASNRVAGDGFTLHVYNPHGLEGTLRVHCIGV